MMCDVIIQSLVLLKDALLVLWASVVIAQVLENISTRGEDGEGQG